MATYKQVAPDISKHVPQADAVAIVSAKPVAEPEPVEPAPKPGSVLVALKCLKWGVKTPSHRVPPEHAEWNVRSYRGIAKKSGLTFDQVRALEPQVDAIAIEAEKPEPFKPDPKAEPEPVEGGIADPEPEDPPK